MVTIVGLSAIVLLLIVLFPDPLPKDGMILSAVREASLGGVRLNLYQDRSFELVNVRGKPTSSGTFTLQGDTLTLTATTGKIAKDFGQTSFIIEKGVLVEVQNTGINFLEIDVNKLGK